ncbi:MAG TPA: leucyl aminopeptidase [Terriglobales bacterium]|nr:leucyl aminopeptidase [Terriglobales bacterium]
MNIHLHLQSPADLVTECFAVPVLDHGEGSANQPKLLCNDPGVFEAAKEVLHSGEVTGKSFETTLIHRPHGLKAKRLLLIGGGKAKNFGAAEMRRLAGTAVRFMKPRALRSVAIFAPEIAGGAVDAIRCVVEGSLIGNFDPDTYKSDRKDQSVNDVTIVTSADKAVAEQAVKEGRIIGESQNYTRVMVNEPSNRLTPTKMGEFAKQMAKETGIKCEVYGADKIKDLKMGAFWSVAQGSEEPPALIVMTYEPEGAPASPVLGLVGKGITFDTGGISIKPSDGMEKMKYDMAGGATMIGAMRAIAMLKPKVKVIGIVCATENMPSGKAQKPGDVQIAMSGKSIEIINTDAEGRLVLADGLHYARQLGATHLIDAATLTGACVIALGYVNVGVFANDDGMAKAWSEAHKRAGEKMWRLPLDADYFESIRSNIADIMNSGGRWGGAVTAAMFLKEFVADTPWIHLDIAGTAWIEDNKAWIAKGPSGIAVRSIIEFTQELAGGGVSGGTVGFTGGTQEKSQPGTKAAKERSDKGAGL